MPTNTPNQKSARRMFYLAPFAALMLLFVSSVPVQAGLLPSLPSIGADLGADTPLGHVGARVDGTNVYVDTPVAKSQVNIDGTSVSACADAYAPAMSPAQFSASACASADPSQQIEQVTKTAGGLSGLLGTIGGFLRGIF